jgi:hypothetical protein
VSILAALALRAAGADGAAPLLVWIGRRVWPWPVVLGRAVEHSLFVDPPDTGARLWAIDQCLRGGVAGGGAGSGGLVGVVVVADASGLDMAGSRRLQLAAESGRGAIGLLARPPRERGVISAAESRWWVAPQAMEDSTRQPRWRLELLRCKGMPMAQSRAWIVEWMQGEGHEEQTPALRAVADVADRPPPEAPGAQATG